MKVAIYGSAVSASASNKIAIGHAREIGKLLAENGHIVVTGACKGIPFEAAMAAFNADGKVIGYSPAISKKDHKNRFKDPLGCFTEMIFVPQNYEHVQNKIACYKYRNISTAMNCDKAIIIGGRCGTMDEFIKVYEFGKEIGVLKNTEGAAGFIATDLAESSFKKIYKDTGAKVYFGENPKNLLKAMKLV